MVKKQQTTAQVAERVAMGEPKRYTGTKTLKAWPLTLGEYNAYLGCDMPEGEDPEAPGYMVEYEPDGKPNIAGHEGYVSWSPADVFERTYKEVREETYVTRMDDEGRQLGGRLAKLRDFMATHAFDTLPLIDREELKAQETYMNKYLDVLRRRYDRALLAQQTAPDGDTPEWTDEQFERAEVHDGEEDA